MNRRRKIMDGKLKSLNTVIKTFKSRKSSGYTEVYHSCGKSYARMGVNEKYWPVDVDKFFLVETVNDGDKKRKIYRTPRTNNYSYYDEWFEWIGEEPEIIPKELWDIGDW